MSKQAPFGIATVPNAGVRYRAAHVCNFVCDALDTLPLMLIRCADVHASKEQCRECGRVRLVVWGDVRNLQAVIVVGTA